MKYVWRKSSRFNRHDPEIIGRRLSEIQRATGEWVSAADVVADARNETSPLNPLFEWDDREAGEQYRLQQARTVLNSIRVIHMDDNDTPQTEQPLFVHVALSEEERGYITTVRAMSDEEIRHKLLMDAIRDLDAWRRRYDRFEELVGVYEVIETVQDRLKAVKGQAS